MRKLTIAAVALLVAAVVAVMHAGWPAGESEASSVPRVITVLGVAEVQGQRAFVHIAALVGPGQDDQAVAEAALREQGARRATPQDLESANFATTGLVWDQFGDDDPGNDFVTQYYNPASDPTGGAGETAVTNTHATWTDVATSSFAFAYGGTTDRCPSLVRECPGDQTFDGFNDFGWVDLGRCSIARCTLGVTWFSTSIDEADVALNTRASWHAGATSCSNVSGAFDAQTVALHENGHVVGLGHSDVDGAVMEAFYEGARCNLHQDDIDGVSFLYPADGGEPAPTATATDTPEPTATPTEGPSPTPTNTPEPFCPPGHRRQGLC